MKQDSFEALHHLGFLVCCFLAGYLANKGIDSLLALTIPILWFIAIFIIKRKVFGKIWNKESFDQIWFQENPRGSKIKITDKKSGSLLGYLSSEQVKQLVDIYKQYGIPGNDFLFYKPGHGHHGHHPDFEFMAHEEKFPPDIYEFIRAHVYERGEIVFHWESSGAA